MTISFEFLAPSLKNFKACLVKSQQASLLQSYAYAYAIRMTQKIMPRLGVIKKDDKPVGFFCAHEASIFFNVFRVFTLDRGPIWFDGHGNKQDWIDFAQTLDRYIPKKFGTSRRLMPELPYSTPNIDIFTKHNWSYRANKPIYKTIILDIDQGEEKLKANMKKNWRNALSKAEKIKIDVARSDNTQQELEWFLKEYLKDRLRGKYPGPGLRLLTYLLGEAIKSNELIILKAIQGKEIIAAIALIKHGQQATYQIGWTSRQGRALNAHHFLLWKGMLLLKKEGIKTLDLGGINDDTAKGVTEFKLGLGGKELELIGQFG